MEQYRGRNVCSAADAVAAGRTASRSRRACVQQLLPLLQNDRHLGQPQLLHLGQVTDVLHESPWLAFAFEERSSTSVWCNKVAVKQFGQVQGFCWAEFIPGLSGRLGAHMEITMQCFRSEGLRCCLL